YALRRRQATLNSILSTAILPNGIYRQHLQQCLTTLQSDMALACLYYQVATSEEAISLDAISAYKLESLGLICFESGLVKPSCDLYRRYFGEQLQAICR
ncbi:AAA-like domain-containing protein, partial [cf. Phormidesmis sp. LEGE 11477]|uniref:AAA-like domain-containing protein n=1 Tax=cf. Phormidesmis sp. LEGE 11477 TaxID=1828680 RepID=UPI00187F3936